MKKLLSLIILLSFCSVLAQAPQKMSYQAIIRNSADGLVVSSNVSMKVSILKGSISGTPVYVETHTGNTNVNGLLSIEIGTGNVSSGNFSSINWGNDSYFIKTETDPDGGSNYTITGASQLLSVPYALYAENTKPSGKSTIYLKGDVTNAEAAEILAKELGPNTEYVYITDTTVLTSVDLAAATSLIKLMVTDNTALASLTGNNISKIHNELIINTNPALTTVSFNALTTGDTVSLSQNNALQAISFPNLQKTTATLIINNCLNLTALSFPALTKGKIISISYCQSLTSLNLSNYTTGSGSFEINQCNALASLSLPNFSSGGGIITFTNTGLTSLVLPALTICAGLYIQNNSSLLNVSFPSLQYTPNGGITVSGNQALTNFSTPNLLVSNIYYTGTSLTTVNFNSLNTGGVIQITQSNIQNLNFPALVNARFTITNNPQLTSIGIPNLSTFLGNVNYFSNNHLPSSEVNNILNKMLTVLPASGKSIYLKQLPAAPPTGQGITDKAALISSGNTVNTD